MVVEMSWKRTFIILNTGLNHLHGVFKWDAALTELTKAKRTAAITIIIATSRANKSVSLAMKRDFIFITARVKVDKDIIA